eukprot:jgi/Tetstr1/448556/TSEL_035814.t1
MVTIKVIRFDGKQNNSPFYNLQCLMYEGDDCYDNLAFKGKATLDELEALERDGLLLGEEGDEDRKHVNICLLEGGDLKYLNSSSGLNGCSSENPCPWCNVCKDHFALSKHDGDMGYCVARDLIRQIKMSHSVVSGIVEAGPGNDAQMKDFPGNHEGQYFGKPPLKSVLGAARAIIRRIKMSHSVIPGVVEAGYKCDGCDAEIKHDQDAWPSSDIEDMEFPGKHGGQLFGKPPGKNEVARAIRTTRKVPDLLHLLLRVVSHLYWHTVQKHFTSDAQAKDFHKWMRSELKVKANSTIRKSKNQDAPDLMMKKKESFIGKECQKILGQYEKVVNHAWDKVIKNGKHKELEARKQHAMEAWEQFRLLWTHLCTRIGAPDSDTMPDKTTRARAARRTQMLGDREYGNLMDYSCQGSEHVHILVKKGFRGSNGRKCKVEQVMTKVCIQVQARKNNPDPTGSSRGAGKKAYSRVVMQESYELVRDVTGT